MIIVEREGGLKCSREPDIFLSHSSKDKSVVRRLATDLSFLEVDSWLDEWEIAPAASLYDSISDAMEKSRMICVVITENFARSRWTSDELKQALARERRSDQNIVLPLICSGSDIPAFLEDKKYLDFRDQYYHSLTRLAGLIHGVSQHRIENAVSAINPHSISNSISAMRYMGIEPYMIVGKDDFEEIMDCGGEPYRENRLRLDPHAIRRNPNASPHVKHIMDVLINEVWVS